jgi:DNA-binding transcriptional regulator LsrR (DeoR family)
MTIGIAWGTTLEAISRKLLPKSCKNVDLVQLNGSANVFAFNNFYIGEIYSRFATVFFRADGSFHDIPINDRASGPDLAIVRSAKHALCVVSGLGKVDGLRAALRGS